MNLIIVTSVINTINEPLSYTETRSVFTAEQRFEQTIKSIESIKKNIKNSFIVLVEGSQIDEKYETILKNIVDHYYNVSNNVEIRKNIDSSSKLRGEISLIISYLSSEFFDKSLFKTISKLSGRYYLTDNFIDIDDYLKNNNVLYSYVTNAMYTVFYSLNINEYNDFYNSLEYIYNNLDSYEYQSIENVLYSIWLKNKNYNSINTMMGVGGNVSINNQFILI
jgi:hypothetical protein